MQLDQAFAGLKVLTVAKVYAAPFAAYQLALHGADVICIEEPGKGDSTRTGGSAAGKPFSEKHMGTAFLAHGANKRSLTLNLRKPEAQAIFRKMAAGADVIIENLRTGDMERYGLGYEDIRAINPRIIYSSLTGYGQTGPKKRDAAIDMVIQAASGLMSVTGTPDSGPLRVGVTSVDYQSGLSLSLALVIALYHRERTGEGQRVDVSMLETALVCMSAMVSDVQNAGFEPRRVGNKSAAMTPVSDTIMCKDTHIMIASSNPDRRKRLFDAIGRPDILQEPRFATVELLRQNIDELYEAINPVFAQRTAAEWEEILNKAGIPAMRIQSVREASQQQQVRERGLYHEFDNVPGLGRKISVATAPYKLSRSPARLHSPPPQLGQHTEEILGGLGLTAADISRMRSEGII